MSLPAIRAVRERFPDSQISVLARPWVADLYRRESSVDRILRYDVPGGTPGWEARKRAAADLRAREIDCAILLPNSFESAMLVWMARIPCRIGYRRDGRGWLLTQPVHVPEPGEIPRHQRFYYLELLRRAGVIDDLPPVREIRLEGMEAAAAEGREMLLRAGLREPVVGVSPGAAFGAAKRWLPERFSEVAIRLAGEHGGTVALFGSESERDLCAAVAESIRRQGVTAGSFAGATGLAQFAGMAAACRLFLTNDSGAMHIASAAGVPTVTVFGATDHTATGPTGASARIVRRQVECSPCLLRECPIDHRCMTAISVQQVAGVAAALWEETSHFWIRETRSSVRTG